MADDAAKKTIGDYFTLQRGMTYKSVLLGLPGPVLLGLASIERNGGFRSDSLKTYGGNSAEKLLLHPGDLYVSLKDVTQSADLLGAVSRVPDFCAVGRLTQDTVKLEPKLPDVPLSYLYWLLRTPQYRDYCRSHATGTTNLGLSREDFLAFTVPTPSCEQKRIVEILDALDDKIELNRRRNRTLESLARAIFQSWFVDFNPVRAKLDGRRPAGMDAATAQLFPDTFTDSPLGPIPTGWRVLPLPEVCDVNPSRTLRKGEVAPYLDMSNMPTQGPTPNKWTTRETGSGAKFINGDTLVARITPCLENGKTAFVNFLPENQVGWGSTEYIVLRPLGNTPPLFAYLLARTDDFRVFAINQMTGSTGRQRVPAESLSQFQIAWPGAESGLLPRFGQIIAPMFDDITAAARQSRTLTALRDSLLPKLISGELRVAEAERIVEDVA